MMIIYDDNAWGWYMLVIYDAANTWWEYDDGWWQHIMMIIYDDHIDDHIWWSYTMITFDDHLCSSYLMLIYDEHIRWWSGSHVGVIWKTFENHLGSIWEPFGTHLGAMWDPFGTSGRMEAEEASGGQISDTSLPLQRNAKVPLTFQFHKGVLRVPSIMTAYLQQHLLTTCVQDLRYSSRALYQDCENPKFS